MQRCSTPGFLEGLLPLDQLDSTGREALESHLAECPSCRGRVAFLERLDTVLERGQAALFSDHPEGEEILAFVGRFGGPVLGPTRTAEVSAHVEACVLCREEVQRLRDFEDPADEPAAAPQRAAPVHSLDRARRGRWLWGGVAVAAAAAGILVATTLLAPAGLVRDLDARHLVLRGPSETLEYAMTFSLSEACYVFVFDVSEVHPPELRMPEQRSAAPFLVAGAHRLPEEERFRTEVESGPWSKAHAFVVASTEAIDSPAAVVEKLGAAVFGLAYDEAILEIERRLAVEGLAALSAPILPEE